MEVQSGFVVYLRAANVLSFVSDCFAQLWEFRCNLLADSFLDFNGYP